MLILKAYINKRKIDEIRIQNTGAIGAWGQHIYRISKPVVDVDILHHRSAGWKILARKALNEIAWNKNGTVRHDTG